MSKSRYSNQTTFVIILMALLLLAGCAAKGTRVPHPNAIDSFDASAYDSLTVAQGALDQAKADFKAGKLPLSTKNPINAAGAIYDSALVSWETYRDVAMGLKSGDLTSLRANLNSNIERLKTSIASLQAITGGGH